MFAPVSFCPFGPHSQWANLRLGDLFFLYVSKGENKIIENNPVCSMQLTICLIIVNAKLFQRRKNALSILVGYL